MYKLLAKIELAEIHQTTFARYMACLSNTPVVLVTGASGYLASHIIRKLLECGEYVVRGTVRNVHNENKVKPLHQLCPDAKFPLELVEADLLDKDCWTSAVQGCTNVIHVASPFPPSAPKNEDDVIKPAVEGTRCILRACAEANVKRVVLTSSCAAIYVGNQDRGYMLTEKDWSIADKCSTYEKSKLLAEQAAWKFVEDLPADRKIELVVMNPGFILGPVLHKTTCTSMELHRRLLQREMPMIPKLQLPLIDVRDAAEAHVKALSLPNVVGNRFILSSGSMWMREFAQTLEREFKPLGYSIPTTYSPTFGVHFLSWFDKSIKSILQYIGKVVNLSNEKMIKELDITPIEMEKSIIDMAYNLIDNGFIKKTNKYKELHKE